eukprot:scaffold195916_cov34-Tisochrysis_lutea.AAC.2
MRKPATGCRRHSLGSFPELHYSYRRTWKVQSFGRRHPLDPQSSRRSRGRRESEIVGRFWAGRGDSKGKEWVEPKAQ